MRSPLYPFFFLFAIAHGVPPLRINCLVAALHASCPCVMFKTSWGFSIPMRPFSFPRFSRQPSLTLCFPLINFFTFISVLRFLISLVLFFELLVLSFYVESSDFLVFLLLKYAPFYSFFPYIFFFLCFVLLFPLQVSPLAFPPPNG